VGPPCDDVSVTYRSKVELYNMMMYRVFFNKRDMIMALRFTMTIAPLAMKRTLPMTQRANNIWNEGKFLPLFTDHRC
jgi:hypothetical protein